MTWPRFRIRGADEGDADFLEHVFVLAADWNPERALGADHWRADPMRERYIGGWKRASDAGFVVEEEGEPVGGAWLRFFGTDRPGYGFVDEETPELTIGVLDHVRGKGVGLMLMQALIDAAPGRLSLSVEDDNPARRLYERSGFVPVGRVGGSVTMLHRQPVA